MKEKEVFYNRKGEKVFEKVYFEVCEGYEPIYDIYEYCDLI